MHTSRLAIAALLLVTAGCQNTSEQTVRPASPATAPATGDPVSGTNSTPASAAPTTSTTAITTATSCAQLADLVVDGLQGHVDAYASTTPEGVTQTSAARAGVLTELATSAGTAATRLGCSGAGYRDLLTVELDRLQATSGVQRAVAATFVSALLGGDDPSDPGATTMQVATSQELRQALAVAGTGSTIEVAPGGYDLDTSLVVLRPLTVVGAGTGHTTIASSASGAAIIIATVATVTLANLTVEAGASGASGIAVTAGGLELDDVVVQNAARDDDGAGGFGLVLAPDTTQGADGSEQHTVTDTTFRDNAGGAILVDGAISPTLQRLDVTATTGCGLCWIGKAGGLLEDSRVEGGEVAVRVEGDAMPTIRDTELIETTTGVVVLGAATPVMEDVTIRQAVAGIEVGGAATPQLHRVTMTDNRDVGLRMAGTSAASVDDVTITGMSPGGIGILEQASPTITGGSVDLDGEVGVLFGGSGTGTISDMQISGARIGLQVSDQAHPTVANVTVTKVGDAAFLVVGDATATLTGLQCDDDDTGIVGLQTTGSVDVADDVACDVVEPG